MRLVENDIRVVKVCVCSHVVYHIEVSLLEDVAKERCVFDEATFYKYTYHMNNCVQLF